MRGFPSAPEQGHQGRHAAGHVFFDGLHADAEPLGGLPLRKAFDPPENKNLPGPPGQLRQKPADGGDFFAELQLLLGRSLRRQNFQFLQIAHRIDGNDARVAHMVYGDRRRGLDRIAQGIFDGIQVRLGRDPGINLLDDIIDFQPINVHPAQPRTQQRLMRQQMTRQPTTPVTEIDIQDILARLSTEIGDQAIDRGLQLRTVPCSARVQSDPILLERMVRNLLVNALRYTTEGRILLGCRRRSDANGALRLSIEVWDTGPGIAEAEMTAIFDDFYRCGTEQRDSGRGLGLGLSIVRRMSQMLDHPVTVRSQVGRGTVFAVSVPLVEQECSCCAAAE